MNKFFLLATLAASLMLSGCKGNPLAPYAEETVRLTPARIQGSLSSVELKGSIDFRTVSFEIVQRERCDSFDCRGPWSGSCSVITGHCYSEGPGWCQSYCRMEEVQERNVVKTPSPVTVKVRTADGSDLFRQNILAVVVGVNTTEAYAAVAEGRATAPKQLAGLFAGASAKDGSFVVVNAKGYKLSSVQNYQAPANFKAGDAVSFEVVLEKSDSATAAISAAGLSQRFPKVETIVGGAQ